MKRWGALICVAGLFLCAPAGADRHTYKHRYDCRIDKRHSHVVYCPNARIRTKAPPPGGTHLEPGGAITGTTPPPPP